MMGGDVWWQIQRDIYTLTHKHSVSPGFFFWDLSRACPSNTSSSNQSGPHFLFETPPGCLPAPSVMDWMYWLYLLCLLYLLPVWCTLPLSSLLLCASPVSCELFSFFCFLPFSGRDENAHIIAWHATCFTKLWRITSFSRSVSFPGVNASS